MNQLQGNSSNGNNTKTPTPVTMSPTSTTSTTAASPADSSDTSPTTSGVNPVLNPGLLAAKYLGQKRHSLTSVGQKLSLSVQQQQHRHSVELSGESSYYRPQRSCGQGYVFTRVCDSVHRGGVCLSACWDTATPLPGRRPSCQGDPPEGGTPEKEAPPWKENPQGGDPQEGGTPLPRRSTPPPTKREAPPGPHPRGKLRGIRSRPTPKGEIERDQIQAPHIRSMSGRYASYWNAFLLL